MTTFLARWTLPIFALALAFTAARAAVATDLALRPANGPTRAAPAAGGATLTFQRIFKSSSPEFIEISVREDSDEATYEIRQLDDDPGAAKFQVSAALRGKMFAMAQTLNHFQGQDLDVHRKIANLGEKRFR